MIGYPIRGSGNRPLTTRKSGDFIPKLWNPRVNPLSYLARGPINH